MCGVAGIYAYHYAAAPVELDELRSKAEEQAKIDKDNETAGNEQEDVLKES